MPALTDEELDEDDDEEDPDEDEEPELLIVMTRFCEFSHAWVATSSGRLYAFKQTGPGGQVRTAQEPPLGLLGARVTSASENGLPLMLDKSQ